MHWVQTEAPKHDGGVGYRGLRLRQAVVGTRDGLAKDVYVRESRRIKAELTVLEQHVGVEARGGVEGAEPFPDSVGVGSYRSTRPRGSAPTSTSAAGSIRSLSERSCR